jgi:hypothetical protein
MLDLQLEHAIVDSSGRERGKHPSRPTDVRHYRIVYRVIERLPAVPTRGKVPFPLGPPWYMGPEGPWLPDGNPVAFSTLELSR